MIKVIFFLLLKTKPDMILTLRTFCWYGPVHYKCLVWWHICPLYEGWIMATCNIFMLTCDLLNIQDKYTFPCQRTVFDLGNLLNYIDLATCRSLFSVVQGINSPIQLLHMYQVMTLCTSLIQSWLKSNANKIIIYSMK